MIHDNKLLRCALTTFFLIVSLGCYAQNFQFGSPFSDNMVLQQSSSVKIWGTGMPDASIKIKASWTKKKYKTTINPDGKWMLSINTPKASEKSFSIKADNGAQTITLKNVLIGEVWLCSGQSNMVTPLRKSTNGKKAIANATDASIRYLDVPRGTGLKEQDSFSASWEVASPSSAGKFSAVAYYFGKMLSDSLKVPIGLIRSAYGASSVQAWTDGETLEQFDFMTMPDTLAKQPQKTPTATYNAMIHPLIGYGMQGVIWYQGEANRREPEVFAKVFPAMINSWRDKWEIGDFPFYYVQIVPFRKFTDGPLWNVMKDIHYEVENTGFAVTLDLKYCENIHPPDKKPVGERLARWALAKDYGYENIVYSGPLATAAHATGNTVKIDFDHSETGLVAGSNVLSGFEVAGEDEVFHAAEANINEDNTLTLSSSSVPDPKYARYGFAPCTELEVTLFNGAGLPASAFIIEATQAANHND